jgi:UDP-2-acetamido-3-amino-2,3-dideoxy-glucuronate N-acetyltransferase
MVISVAIETELYSIALCRMARTMGATRMADTPFIHPLAQVEDGAEIGARTKVWAGAQIRRGAQIGADCIIGSGVTVDLDVVVGDRCKVQNAALLYRGLRVGDGVFIGPAAVFTNDRLPRAVAPSGEPLGSDGWEISPTTVDDGASIGANATVVCGVRIGRWALVGAGAVVICDVPAHALVVGVPARQVGWVCACGSRVESSSATCRSCGFQL